MPEFSPPPWIINMQRFGPPPSYPNLKIPGLNVPLDYYTQIFEEEGLKEDEKSKIKH